MDATELQCPSSNGTTRDRALQRDRERETDRERKTFQRDRERETDRNANLKVRLYKERKV